MKKIVLSSLHSEKKFSKNFKVCVGSGNMSLALRKEFLDSLDYVQKKIGFQYIRGHGIFSDVMGVYKEAPGLTYPYNFTYVDKVYDAFLERGIRPIVEIGFMPDDMASGPETVFEWRGKITPPKDYKLWCDLVKNFVEHLLSRYGIDEVSKWLFEIWNEPNFHEFWVNTDMDEYFKLYKYTATTIKEVNENLKVGGPAADTNGDEWLAPFFEFCDKNNLPLDFVTRHAYTSTLPQPTPEYDYQTFKNNTFILDKFKNAREIMNNSAYADLPLYITEYNTSYTPKNPIHDTIYNAICLARILSEGGDYADAFSYWTFCDVFEELGKPRAQYHGGFGMLAQHIIPKPTFHLFEFFNHLGETLLYRDDSIIITGRDNGSVSIVVWNDVLHNKDREDFDFDITMPAFAQEVFVKRQTVDEDHANPFKVWQLMGRPRYPDKTQVEALTDASKPDLETSRIKSENDLINIRFNLKKNAFSLIEMYPVNDETNTYSGLDDSRIFVLE